MWAVVRMRTLTDLAIELLHRLVLKHSFLCDLVHTVVATVIFTAPSQESQRERYNVN